MHAHTHSHTLIDCKLNKLSKLWEDIFFNGQYYSNLNVIILDRKYLCLIFVVAAFIAEKLVAHGSLYFNFLY